MFTLSETPLDPKKLTESLNDPRAGALVSFDGWVRDHHDGKPVTRLHYEAFPEMVALIGNEILEEARERFSILNARAEHRIGDVAIGERAVWVGVTAEHRQEAFLACRWIMDQIKIRVPVWKKEFYQNGETVWIHAGDGSTRAETDPADDPRYARQVKLPQVGPEGQRTLADSSILVIGAGGLGCPALLYLAGAGVGHITICDGDRVDISNLHRQTLFTAEDIGLSKAESAAEHLRAFHPGLSVKAVAEAADSDTLPELLQGHSLVLDCTDSFESTYAIHDHSYRMGVPLVQAAVYQTDGWIQLIDPAAPFGCFRCLWPESPEPGCVGNCADAGVLGVTPGLLGMYQAIESLKYLLDLPDRLDNSTLYVDVLSGETRTIRRPIQPDCPCRGQTPWPVLSHQLLYPGSRTEQLLRHATILDIRQPEERTGNPAWIQQTENVPRESWSDILQQYPQRPLILGCAAGVRTRQCLAILGHPPGVYAWTRSILELGSG